MGASSRVKSFMGEIFGDVTGLDYRCSQVPSHPQIFHVSRETSIATETFRSRNKENEV